MKLTEEQYNFVLKSLNKYLEVISSREGAYFPTINMIDLGHSSLFERLLRNPEDVFENPPPKRMSYPWVDLVKHKSDRCDVWFGEPGNYFEGKAVIEQSPWNILEKISESEYIVQYAGQYPWKAKITKHEKNEYRPWVIELI